jgi:N-acylglucosamine 2-epimerase
MMDVFRGRRAVEPKIIPTTRRLASLAGPMIVLATTDELCRIDPDARYEAIMDECTRMIRDLFYHETYDCLVETIDLDGHRSNISSLRAINPGHVLEAGWFLLHSNERRRDSDVTAFALHMIDRALEIGWDKEFGGLFSFVDAEDKPPERLEWDMKMWWPHTEALYSTLLAYRLTRQEKYWRWFEMVHEYTFSHFPDPAHGEWFGYLHRDGTVANTLKGSHWKGMFHIPRALLFCLQIFDQLLEENP